MGQAALVPEELPDDPEPLDAGVDEGVEVEDEEVEEVEEVEDDVDSDAGVALVVESPEVVVLSLPVLPESVVDVEDDVPRASFL